jgi:hypothetical protein
MPLRGDKMSDEWVVMVYEEWGIGRNDGFSRHPISKAGFSPGQSH